MSYKLKTKSSAKKRFKFTATGLVIAGQAGKRHNLRKLSQRQTLGKRGTTILGACDAKLIKKYMPYQ